MRKLSLIPKIYAAMLGILLLFSSYALAESPSISPPIFLGEQDHFYLDKTQLVVQQIGLLQKRFAQANQDFVYLQNQQKKGFVEAGDDRTNKFLLYKAGLHIASSKSNLDSINIELTDSQQALMWLEKNIQETENQLNALNIFGLKLIHGDVIQIHSLRAELKYQKNLYQLEKTRAEYLYHLQKIENSVLQLYNDRYIQVNALLKSRKMLHIKEQQVKSEIEFQQQQNYWLQKLDALYAQMKNGEMQSSRKQYAQLEGEIFYANENINLVYLKTLIARYQDQVRQMRLSVTHTNSISVLNTMNDQTVSLSKQIMRVDNLLKTRIEIIKKRRALLTHEKQNKDANSLFQATEPEAAVPLSTPEANKFSDVETSYLKLHDTINTLNTRLFDFRGLLDKSIQNELSARQGLPGFSSRAWLDLGREALLVPTLSFQLVKGFTFSLIKAFKEMSPGQWLLFGLLEAAWVMMFLLIRKSLKNALRIASEVEHAVTNIKYLIYSVLSRNLIPLGIITNLLVVSYCLAIPRQQFNWIVNLAVVWLFFRSIWLLARIGLVETVHDNMGHDVQLYHRLTIIFSFGAVITFLTAFLHQLPLIYEMKDLFDRLFLLLLLIVSLLILRSWRVVPQLILQYVESGRTYLRRIIYFLGIFIPTLLFINSLIGLFGFVNLVGMISWHEGIFTVLLIAYFFFRDLLADATEALSRVMIKHVNNGWLWTEAFLKPLHSILHLSLFLGAWTLLFIFYGWDQQSHVVERLNNLLNYPIIAVLNTTITPLSLLKLTMAVSLFYWAARWTREFVFRLLLSKTHDLGIRNSIAILSQYAVVALGALMSLRLLGIDLHALFLVGSGLLIAISFALRDLFNNFACGLLLLFERPIRVGDIVSVSEHEGRVTHIGSRAVTIRTWDHMEMIVPNTELFNKSFINWTVKDDVVRTVITIKIEREDNPHDVRKVIEGVLQEHKDVMREPVPEVFLKEMLDSTSEFEVRYFINIRNVVSRVGVRSEVLYALWNAFSQHGIKAPHLQHQISIKTPTLPSPAIST